MKLQEYYELQSAFKKEGQSIFFAIANVLKGSNYIDRSTLVATAYVLYISNDAYIDMSSLMSFCQSINADDDRIAFLESSIGDVWPMVVGQRYRYSSNGLKALILFYEDRELRYNEVEKTPPSISRLACKLFDFSDNDIVADFGIGSAAFCIEAYMNHPNLRFYGIDINATYKEIASIRLEVLGCSFSIERGNIFDMHLETHRFKYIFSNYPFGLRIRDVGFDRNYLLQEFIGKYYGITRSVSSDWFFNASIVECLDQEGKGIAIMTNGSTWNTVDKSVRKYFVDNGMIEAVIALPDRMFEGTNISTTMVIFSKNKKDKIMFVDATDMCDKGRRFNSFNDEQIDKIAYAVANETRNSRYVLLDELAENDYVINPTRYLAESIVVENGVPFETVIKSITRGAPLSAADLDHMVSDKPTNYQYLMLANIQHGQIDSELPYLKTIQDNQKKYCLKNHSLILSKNGAPFKIAVAEIKPENNILANGNLYIIEIDEDKADPYFIKAFLESEKGIALLKSITVGATIPNIGIEALKKIKIPSVPIDKQREMSINYLAKMDEIALYKLKLEKAYEELNHFYDSIQ